MREIATEAQRMKERPVLFSAPMIRANLADTKTQTRRALRVQPGPSCCIEEGMVGESPFMYSQLHGDGPGHEVHERRAPCVCPYGQPGDRLWVREAWRVAQKHDATPPRDLAARAMTVLYEAGGYGTNTDDGWGQFMQDEPRPAWTGKYRPPMFMPRWASRILLEITDIRVERLQDISEADAVAEGILAGADGWHVEDGKHFHCTDPRQSYFSLWEAINGPGSVETNPWLWVIAFKRVTP